jgi:pSer/pThr/pTyr-binding forkhead associated (FHA) protein
MFADQEEEYEAPMIEKPVLVFDAPALFGSKKKTYAIKSRVTTLGRSSNNTLSFDDCKQSRNHAKIELRHGQPPVLYDLGSTFGTTVNDQPITKQPLRIGDRIGIGKTTITVEGRTTHPTTAAPSHQLTSTQTDKPALPSVLIGFLN